MPFMPMAVPIEKQHERIFLRMVFLIVVLGFLTGASASLWGPQKSRHCNKTTSPMALSAPDRPASRGVTLACEARASKMPLGKSNV